MHSKRLGSIGEAKTTQFLLSQNLAVFKEIFGDLSKSDLIFEYNQRLIRVQCKTVTSKNEVVNITLAKSGPGYKYCYTELDFDILSVYVIDKDCLLFLAFSDFPDNQYHLNIRFAKPKNNQNTKIWSYTEFTNLERLLRDYTGDIHH